MAVIDPQAQTRALYRNDGPHRIVVLGVRSVTTGDTAQFNTSAISWTEE